MSNGLRPSAPASGGTTSERLLEGVRQGRASALDALLRRHIPYMRALARGRISRWARQVSDTNDVIQDVLLRTFQRLPKFESRGHGALRAYLRRAVQNRLNDIYGDITKRGAPQDLDERMPDPSPSPCDVAVGGATAQRYRAALLKLSKKDRLLIVGRVELGYTHEQLAMILEYRLVDSARVALLRALKRLADEMSCA